MLGKASVWIHCLFIILTHSSSLAPLLHLKTDGRLPCERPRFGHGIRSLSAKNMWFHCRVRGLTDISTDTDGSVKALRRTICVGGLTTNLITSPFSLKFYMWKRKGGKKSDKDLLELERTATKIMWVFVLLTQTVVVLCSMAGSHTNRALSVADVRN